MASSSKPNPSSKNQKSRKSPAIKGDSKLNKPFKPRKSYVSKTEASGLIRLNRFLSNAGIASRREADKLIELGLVSVNGKVVTELGTKIDPKVDSVRYDDRSLKPEALRYVLLNKPKDYLTTTDDPQERKTVMELIQGACRERIYPVGRMDRQTMGLLLFTNDGEMAKRLTRPKHGFPKLYQVETIEKVTGAELSKLRDGVKLEDGFVKVDEVDFVGEARDQRQIGIRINSTKSGVVRKLMEHLGHKVKKIDRVMYAGLTKKDLPRGHYRHLTENEINFLKMIR
jgi:23S rRNA pseudouridine2605 synthase